MDTKDFWQVTGPSSWAEPPNRMSFSSLVDIETCPRRWSLGRADYEHLTGSYPPRPWVGTLSGLVVHNVLEEVSREVSEADHATQGSGSVVQVLKGLGGIPTLIRTHLLRMLADLESNPRAQPLLGRLEIELTRRLPRMRATIQAALQEVMSHRPDVEAPRPKPTKRGRGALSLGVHTEVALEVEHLSWMGVADAIVLSDTECEIIDYKSGGRDQKHHDQLSIYALLWARDSVVNPSGRTATGLTVVYPDGREALAAPDESSLDDLELTLTARTGAALKALGLLPPPANVSDANCRFCDVKQLCGDYWSPAGQAALSVGGASDWRSIQLRVVDAMGGATWLAAVERDVQLAVATEVVVVGGPQTSLQVGASYRLIDARVSDVTASGPAFGGEDPEVRIAASTEVFAL